MMGPGRHETGEMDDGEQVDDAAATVDDVAPIADAALSGGGLRALVERSRERFADEQSRVNELIEKHHDRPLIDVGLRIYERDREAAGTIVGSALAFRLFLFFVPLTLFVVGALGFLTQWIEADDVNDAAGLGGTIAAQINTALSQPDSTRWIATLVGLIGTAWAGRSLSKVMMSASCLSWRLPVTTKASVRVIGAVVGLVATIVIVATVVNLFRRDHGLAIAGVSILAAVAVYGIAWMVMSMLLPRATRDPGALLPGAVVVGAVLAGMQAVVPARQAGTSLGAVWRPRHHPRHARNVLPRRTGDGLRDVAGRCDLRALRKHLAVRLRTSSRACAPAQVRMDPQLLRSRAVRRPGSASEIRLNGQPDL